MLEHSSVYHQNILWFRENLFDRQSGLFLKAQPQLGEVPFGFIGKIYATENSLFAVMELLTLSTVLFGIAEPCCRSSFYRFSAFVFIVDIYLSISPGSTSQTSISPINSNHRLLNLSFTL